MSWIFLNSGKRFDYADLDNQTIDIEDVAHGLSNLCRYSGQVDKYYSIAEHCFWCSVLAPPEDQWEALLHDGPESVLIDVPSPLKALLPDYKAIEKRYETRFAEQFGLRFPFPPSVKEVDIKIRYTEMRQLFSFDGLKDFLDDRPESYPIRLSFWSPAEAKHMFMQRYNTLKKGRSNDVRV